MATDRPNATTRRGRLRWLAVPALATVAWSIAAHPWGWLYGLGVHPYPASSSTPWTYQFLSGFIPALTVLTLLGAIVSMYHVRNCHKGGCWRIGRHRIGGAPWCNHHVADARPQVSTEELLTRILDELRALRGAA
jgi:hypothetical protein